MPTVPAGEDGPAGGPCLVGRWESVGMVMQVDQITASGGAGTTMHIDPSGQTEVDFSGMERVDYSVGGDVPSAGYFVYTGTARGALVLPPPDATSGVWEHADEEAYADVGAHMVITSPFELDLGELSLADLAGDETGVAISSEPVVSGNWQCDGDTLISTAPGDMEVTWTFARTGPG